MGKRNGNMTKSVLAGFSMAVLAGIGTWATGAHATETGLEQQMTHTQEQLATAADQLRGATRGSPAHFRAKAELDRLSA